MPDAALQLTFATLTTERLVRATTDAIASSPRGPIARLRRRRLERIRRDGASLLEQLHQLRSHLAPDPDQCQDAHLRALQLQLDHESHPFARRRR